MSPKMLMLRLELIFSLDKRHQYGGAGQCDAVVSGVGDWSAKDVDEKVESEEHDETKEELQTDAATILKKCDFLRKCVSESHLYQYLLSDMLHLTMKLPLVGTSVTNVAVLPLHIGQL